MTSRLFVGAALSAIALTVLPHQVDASIGCVTREQIPGTDEIVVLPGHPQYDPARYARLLYAHSNACLEDENCILLLGELHNNWRSSKPLPHLQAAERQMEDYRGPDEIMYGVHFDYSDFYVFGGVQITSKGPVPIEPDMVDATAGAAEEGFWQEPMETHGPEIFTAEVTVRDKSGFLRLRVPGIGVCSTFPMPAPDPEATRILTECIVNEGCK